MLVCSVFYTRRRKDTVTITAFLKENHFIVWAREKEIVELLMKLR
jgi:hypothetical protein